MKLATITFAKTVYRISDPLDTWFQQSPDDSPECRECGSELIFCFSPRTDPKLAGFGASYTEPISIRCTCFLDGDDSVPLIYHRRLCRKPVPVTPTSPI
jgi:hypothetical protein